MQKHFICIGYNTPLMKILLLLPLLLLLLLNRGESRTELIQMHRFSLLIITGLAIAGAVSDIQRVEVKSGENITLRVERPGLENARRVTLQKNCENRTHAIIIYCSPEEEKSGCSARKSDRLSISFNTRNLSITLVDARASDEGCYVVSYIDVANIFNENFFNVKVHDFPINSKETPWKSSWIMLRVGITLLTLVVIISSIFVIKYIINCQKQKKKQCNPEAGGKEDDPGEDTPLNSNNNGDEFLEMVDNNKQHSKKDLNHGA